MFSPQGNVVRLFSNQMVSKPKTTGGLKPALSDQQSEAFGWIIRTHNQDPDHHSATDQDDQYSLCLCRLQAQVCTK